MQLLIKAVKSLDPATISDQHVEALYGAIIHFPNERLEKEVKKILVEHEAIQEREYIEEQFNAAIGDRCLQPDGIEVVDDCPWNGSYDNP
jgi:hypothetical protein